VPAAASFVRASLPIESMAPTTELLALVMADTDFVIRPTAALTSPTVPLIASSELPASSASAAPVSIRRRPPAWP